MAQRCEKAISPLMTTCFLQVVAVFFFNFGEYLCVLGQSFLFRVGLLWVGAVVILVFGGKPELWLYSEAFAWGFQIGGGVFGAFS